MNESLDWWDWSTFIFIGVIFGFWSGCVFWSWFLRKNAEHGPNSRDWRGRITQEGDEYYQWDVEICPCPCL